MFTKCVLSFQSEWSVSDISFVGVVGVQYTDFLPVQRIITSKSPSPLTLIVLYLEMAQLSHQKTIVHLLAACTCNPWFSSLIKTLNVLATGFDSWTASVNCLPVEFCAYNHQTWNLAYCQFILHIDSNRLSIQLVVGSSKLSSHSTLIYI